MTRQHRVVAPELQRDIKLRPAPMQGDTYAPPPPPPQDNRLGNLAQALGAFSQSIGNLVPLAEQKSDEDKKRLQWEAERRINGRTREENAQAVRDGTMEVFENDFQNVAVSAIYGDALGADEVERIQRHLQTEFDWDNEDLDEYITRETAALIDQYGADPSLGRPLARRLGSLREWAYEYRAKRLTEQHVETVHTAAFKFLDTRIDDAIGAGITPEELGSLVYSWYGDLGQDGTLGVNYEVLDRELLNKARRMAAEHPEEAMALLHATRKGRGGEMSLASNPEFRDTVIGINATAARAISNREEQSYVAAIRESNVRLLEEGRLDELEDHRYTTALGEERTMSAGEERSRAIQAYTERSRQVAQDNREEPGETLMREYRAFRQSGEKHPTLERMLTNFSSQASIELLQNPEGKERLMQSLGVYQWIQNESIHGVNAYVSEADQQFAETFLQARRYLGYDDDRALELAIRSTERTRQGLPRLGQGEARALDNEMKNLAETDSSFWQFFGFGEAPGNWSIMRQRVELLASNYISIGVKPNKAVELAANAVKRTSTTYNGVMLDLQGLEVPDNLTDVLNEVTDDFAAKAPLALERNDIPRERLAFTLVHSTGASGGRFVLIDKEDMTTVLDDEGNQMFVTASDLRKRGQELQRRRDEETSRRAAEEATRRARGIEHAVDPQGNEVWINPQTREVYEQIDNNGRIDWRKTGRRLPRPSILTNPDPDGPDGPWRRGQ